MLQQQREATDPDIVNLAADDKRPLGWWEASSIGTHSSVHQSHVAVCCDEDGDDDEEEEEEDEDC